MCVRTARHSTPTTLSSTTSSFLVSHNETWKRARRARGTGRPRVLSSKTRTVLEFEIRRRVTPNYRESGDCTGREDAGSTTRRPSFYPR